MLHEVDPPPAASGRCSHDGFHSGLGRYVREAGELRYVMVCDACAQELRVVSVQPYRPDPKPCGRPQQAA